MSNATLADATLNVAAPVVKMTRLLSLMVELAAAAGDLQAFALANAYIFMPIMVTLVGVRPVAGRGSQVRG